MNARHRYLLGVYAGVVLTVALIALAGCASEEDPFLVGDRKAFSEASPTPVPEGQATAEAAQPGSTGGGVATPEAGLNPEDIRGPSKAELIKFANWSDNRVKLTNYIAAYLVAHGLDYPVRMIELEPDAYKEAWINNDVDIVLEADPAWAKERAAAGDLIELGTLAADKPDSKIVVHSRLADYAPAVIAFLRLYVLDGEFINTEAKKISSRAIGVRENIVAHRFLKNQEETWTPWVSPAAAELVKKVVSENTVSLCRKWSIFHPDEFGGIRTRYCEDDPSKHGGNI